jgi:predicted anti-sigma-YlaC factor YlaD
MTDRPTTTEPLPELPCQDLVEVVTDYLEGALSEIDQRRFEEHLEICERCVAYVEQIRVTIAATGRAGVQGEALPADLREGIRDAFRDWAK